jgi:cytochrome c biogenesis protein CcmG, thiol:disulfide interchange protein DsbE
MVPHRLIALLVALVSASFFAPLAAAAQADEPLAHERWLDRTLSDHEREVMLSTLGHAVPEFGAGVEWISAETPTFEEMRGDVVVLYSWTIEDPSGRAMTRRMRTMLRPFTGDGVRMIALHSPEGATEALEKYEGHERSVPVPTAVDTKGAYCDELGIWREPRIVIIDRDGVIRYAGVSLAGLRDAVRATLDRERSDAPAPALPPRDERIEGEAPEAMPDAEFPPHNRIQAGEAQNLQGRQAPELVVESYINGREPELAGKVVMIEFWATWCGPCISGIPHLNALQNSFEDDLVIVGISAESERTVRNKMRTDRRLDFEYLVAVDPKRRVNARVGNRGIPHCIVVSSDGIVRWQGHPARMHKEVMEQIVAANRALSGATPARMRWVSEEG